MSQKIIFYIYDGVMKETTVTIYDMIKGLLDGKYFIERHKIFISSIRLIKET